MTALDILAARRRLAPYLQPTPLRPSAWLSAVTDADVHLKLESVQLTGSFKIRGAFNAALRVLEDADGDPARAPLLVAASAGNHGRALALAAEQLGLRAVIFTPRTAPETKRAAIRRHRADLRDDFPDYDAADEAGRAYAKAEHALYISPYNHPDVIAGAGTAALEIVDVLPAFDALVVPLGGGGLVSGAGLVLEAVAPGTRIIAVETAASTPFAASLARGAISRIDVTHTLADGLAGNLEPGAITFDVVRQVADDVVAVGEDDLAAAIRGLAGEEHLIVEGAGAAGVAAALAKRVVKPGERAVIMVTGSNIDSGAFAAVCAG